MSSCTSCEKMETNNSEGIEGQCPVFNMADGRNFTDYRANYELSHSLASATSAMNSYEYRQYLQHNAEKLMKQKRMEAQERNRCVPCYDFDEMGTMLPEKSKVVCDGDICGERANYNDGLGQGRDFRVKSRTPLLTDAQKRAPKGNFLEFSYR